MTTTTLSDNHAAVARMIATYRADAISAVVAGNDEHRELSSTAAEAAEAVVRRTVSRPKLRAILDVAERYREDILTDPTHERRVDELRRRTLLPLLEDNTPTPETETEELADALACVRYLAKIIREDGNWKDDELSALEWADRIAGLYEHSNGEGNWGPGVGDEAILALTPETIDDTLDAGQDDPTPYNGRRVRVREYDYSTQTGRWDFAIVDVIDGPEIGPELWVYTRDLARPTD